MHKKIFSKFVRWVGYDLGISPNQITLGRLIFFVPGWMSWVFRYDLSEMTGTPWQLWGWLAIFIVTTVIIFDIVACLFIGRTRTPRPRLLVHKVNTLSVATP